MNLNLNHKKKACLAARLPDGQGRFTCRMALQALAIILLLIVQATSFAQNRNAIDSLKTIINNKKAKDTTIIHAYLNLSSEFQDFNLDTALIYANYALKISLNTDYKKGIAEANRKKGVITFYLNNYELADSLLNTAISVFREINDQYGIMKCHINLSGNAYYKREYRSMLEYGIKALKIAENNNYIKDKGRILDNMGIAYKNLGDYEKAIEYALIALKAFEEQGSKKDIAICYTNIGCLFNKNKEHDKALEYLNKALILFTELKYTREQSICYINIGNGYYEQKKYDEALKNYNKSLELEQKNNNLNGISTDYNNIGSVYFELEKYELASEYFTKSLEICRQVGNRKGIANYYYNSAKIQTKLKIYTLAEEYCLKSVGLYRQINDLYCQQKSLELLTTIYNLTRRYKRAFNTQNTAIAIKDSLFNIEKAEKIAQLEEKYLNEKNEKQIQELKYETEIQQIKIKNFKKSHIIYTIVLILAIAAILVILVQFRKKNNAYKFLVRKNIDLLNKEKELKDISEQKIANKPDNNKKATVTDNLKEDIHNKLKQLLDNEKIFKDFDLTLEKLAKELRTNYKYLSIVINEKIGKNYIDFINEYRIKESMLLLSDPEKTLKLSIDGIAKESGFKSLSCFYKVFIKYTGITPSKFRKEAIAL